MPEWYRLLQLCTFRKKYQAKNIRNKQFLILHQWARQLLFDLALKNHGPKVFDETHRKNFLYFPIVNPDRWKKWLYSLQLFQGWVEAPQNKITKRQTTRSQIQHSRNHWMKREKDGHFWNTIPTVNQILFQKSILDEYLQQSRTQFNDMPIARSFRPQLIKIAVQGWWEFEIFWEIIQRTSAHLQCLGIFSPLTIKVPIILLACSMSLFFNREAKLGCAYTC